MSALPSKSVPLLHVTGLNHRTAEIDVRELFALNEERKGRAAEAALTVASIEEVVVLSTCNRVEIVVAATDEQQQQAVAQGLGQVFAKLSGVSEDHFLPRLYHLSQKPALSHIFRVASGLDSLVVGEAQVLGQLKDAYRSASEQGVTGGILHRVFHRAFAAAKAVRTRTAIGKNAVSACYCAKDLAEQIFGDLKDAQVLVLGAGDVGVLAVRHFMAAGVKEFVVLNKTVTRACDLAELCSGVAGSLDQVEQYLSRADIIIGAASLSPGDAALLSAAMVDHGLSSRDGRPQFFIDLAVPRNFDSGINDVSDAFLYNVDDLEAVVQKNLSGRKVEAQRAEVIVEEEVERFWKRFESRSVEASIRELSENYQDFRAKEVEKTIRRLNRMGMPEKAVEDFRDALNDLSHALLAKTLHQPLTVVKEKAAKDPALLEMFRELFLGKKS